MEGETITEDRMEEQMTTCNKFTPLRYLLPVDYLQQAPRGAQLVFPLVLD